MQRLYRLHGIKFKSIKQKKLITRVAETKRKALTKTMKSEVTQALYDQVKIVFVDEAIFSPQTSLAKSWSAKGTNIEQLDMRHKIKTTAYVAGISEECGLETYLLEPQSINQDSFVKFLKKLRKVNKDQPLVIFMDNLVVHKTKVVTQTMQELNMKPIWCVPYSPQFNGIESYFFLVKQEYKKDLL